MAVIAKKEISMDKAAVKVAKKFPNKFEPIGKFYRFLIRVLKNSFTLVFNQKTEPRNKVQSKSYQLNEVDAVKTSTMMFRYTR
ncbi:MAG: hypothetical protein ACW981_14430 [Candidatus Hodarchaeales archaeon]|jgi:hypothetical protein